MNNGSLTSSIKTNHENTHFLIIPLAIKKFRKRHISYILLYLQIDVINTTHERIHKQLNIDNRLL